MKKSKLPPWSVAHRTSTSGCKQVGDDKVVTKLNNTIDVPRNGYLYIYTSNETKNIDVYFDNLQLAKDPKDLGGSGKWLIGGALVYKLYESFRSYRDNFTPLPSADTNLKSKQYYYNPSK